MRKLLSTAILLALFTTFSGCSDGGTDEGQTTGEDAVAADKPQAQEQPDLTGIYDGVLPCADCEGIETTLELKDDSTFSRESIYQGKNFKAEDRGTYSYNVATQVITAKDNDEPGTTLQYRVENSSTLKMLDQQGEEITGPLAENYILRKSDVK